jgi:RNA polymerase sigma-70 factor (ECF subfamily)
MDSERVYFVDNILPLKTRMFRQALRITASIEDAEDAVNDAMLILWDKRKEWRLINNIEVYAMVLVKNIAINKVRRKDRFNNSIDDNADFADIDLNPHDKLCRNEQRRLVDKIISRLPEKMRKMLLLREIEELSYREIADEMQATEEQVKITIFRARQKIKEIFIKTEQYGTK